MIFLPSSPALAPGAAALTSIAPPVSPRGSPAAPAALPSSWLVPSFQEGAKRPPRVKLFTPQYYVTCTLGGIIACGPTHSLVCPLDNVKCRLQVDSTRYKGNWDGFKTIYRTEGLKGVFTGVGPTFIGYSLQGAGKYGFYEVFKKQYSDKVGERNAQKYKTFVYLAASATAEFLADMMLCPWESLKVRMQTRDDFPRQTGAALRHVAQTEGLASLYGALPSLWARQIPYTMVKFTFFEATVERIYQYLGRPKDSYNKIQQLGISFVAGYTAGVACAVVSHPADVLVSKLNAPVKAGEAAPTVGDIVKKVGFRGLWGGLGVRIIMIGTLTATQWALYDQVKVHFGLPPT